MIKIIQINKNKRRFLKIIINKLGLKVIVNLFKITNKNNKWKINLPKKIQVKINMQISKILIYKIMIKELTKFLINHI